MTEAEAIKVLEKEKAYMDSHGGDMQSEALEMAIKALKKQVAKKPVIKSMWSVAKCPCCDAELGEYVNDGYPKNWESLKFCDCGQKLDWSEV